MHGLEHFQGMLVLLALLTGVDQGGIDDYVGHHALLPEFPENFQGPLWQHT